MNVLHFTKNLIMKAQALPADLESPCDGQDEGELGCNQTHVTHFQWKITMFGFNSNLTYTLSKD